MHLVVVDAVLNVARVAIRQSVPNQNEGGTQRGMLIGCSLHARRLVYAGLRAL